MTEPLRVTIGMDSNGAGQVLVVSGEAAVLRLPKQDAARLATELAQIVQHLEKLAAPAPKRRPTCRQGRAPR